MYDWVNIDWNILVMDEQIKSKRLSRSIFLQERYTVQLCQKAGCIVTDDVEFFFCLLLEMRLKQIDIKTWIMEKRMLDTC